VGLNLNGKGLVGMTATGTVTTTSCQGGFRDFRKGSVLLTFNSATNAWYANGSVSQSITSEYPEVANEVEDPWTGWWMFYTPTVVSSIVNGKANGNTFPTLNTGTRAQSFTHLYIDTSTYPITTIWYTGEPSDPSAGGAYSTRALEYYTTGGVVDKTQLVNAYSQVGSLATPPWNANNGATDCQGAGMRLQTNRGLATVSIGQLIPDFQVFANTFWSMMVKLKASPGYTQKSQIESSLDEFFNESDLGDKSNYNNQMENFKSMCLRAIYTSNPQTQQIGGTSAGRFTWDKDIYFVGNTGPNGFNAGGVKAIEVMNQFLSDSGITFTTPITQIIKSYSGPAVVNGTRNWVSTGSTEVTTIFTRGASYCTPGSNVTISGLTGSWSVMNGYYPNGISLWENNTRKAYDSLSMDCVLNNTAYTGSCTNTYNRFNLIYDSWSDAYEAQTTGAFLNYAQNFGLETAQVSVTHKVYPTMGYNELFAAYMAFLNYVFGPITHSRSLIQYMDKYRPNIIGRLATNWHLLGTSAYVSTGSQDICNTRPQEINVAPYILFSRRGNNDYSWHMRNDPYNTNSSIFSAYYVTGTRDGNTISPFMTQNYLLTGTAKALWVGVDGPLYKDATYNTGYFQNAGNSIGLLNVSFTGLTGGSTFVGRMFDVNQAPRSTGGPLADWPDTNYWIKWFTASKSTNAAFAARNQYGFIAGLVNPAYTNFTGYPGWTGDVGTRRIGYINLSTTQADNKWILTSAFAPPVDPTNPTGPYNPKLATGPGAPYNAAVRNAFSAMMSYLVGPTGSGGLAVDSIIIDNRINAGGAGGEGEELSTFFGGDRNGAKTFARKSDDGFSPLVDPDTLTFVLDAQSIMNLRTKTVRVSENIANYPTAVFRGVGSSYTGAKKVVFLNSDAAKSNGSKAVRYYAGDNKDGKIGNNTIVKFVGCVDAKFEGSSITAGYQEDSSDQGNLYMNGLGQYMQWNTETPSYNLQCQYIPTGSTGTLWNHVDYPTFAPSIAKNGFIGLCGTGGTLPQDLQSTLYPGMGVYPTAFAEQQAQFPNLYLTGKTEIPDITKPLTWRDPWIETAIYEAMVPVLPGEN